MKINGYSTPEPAKSGKTGLLGMNVHETVLRRNHDETALNAEEGLDCMMNILPEQCASDQSGLQSGAGLEFAGNLNL